MRDQEHTYWHVCLDNTYNETPAPWLVQWDSPDWDKEGGILGDITQAGVGGSIAKAGWRQCRLEA